MSLPLIRNDTILVWACIIAAAVGIGAPIGLAYLGFVSANSQLVAEWITAAATVVLSFIALFQLRALRKTSYADFIHKLNGDFFTAEARPIRSLIENCADLEFEDQEGGVFLLNGQKKFSAEQLDDLLLGPLEAIGIFLRNGTIDISTTYEMFGSAVLTVWEAQCVKDYITWSRAKPDGEDMYDKLEALHHDCRQYQKGKLRRAERMP